MGVAGRDYGHSKEHDSIHFIRIALCEKSELVGTRAILEKMTLLSGNLDHFYYFLDLVSSFLEAKKIFQNFFYFDP